jgi:outer membrane protein TolC
MIRHRSTRVAALAAAVMAAWPAPAPALDLATVVRTAALYNPALTGTRARSEAAKDLIAPSYVWPSPMIELGVLDVPTSGRFDMDPMTMKMIGVVQRVPVSGSTGLYHRAAVEAARAETLEGEEALRATYGLAWQTYGDLWAAERLVEAVAAQREVVARILASARARYGSGQGRLDEVLAAEAESARLQVEASDFAAEARTARARLNVTCGFELEHRLGVPEDPPAAVPAHEAVLRAAVATHPRLERFTATANRYRFTARAMGRMGWPELELRGSYGRRRDMADGMPLDDMWSAVVAVRLPTFGRTPDDVESQRMDVMARVAEVERRGAELDLMREAREAHDEALAAARAARLLADTVVVTSRRAEQAAWASYASGALDLAGVLARARALYQDEQAVVRARQRLARAQARIVTLTGRTDLVGLDPSFNPAGDTR